MAAADKAKLELIELRREAEEIILAKEKERKQNEAVASARRDVWYQVGGAPPIFKAGSRVRVHFINRHNAYANNIDIETTILSDENGVLHLKTRAGDYEEWTYGIEWSGVRQLYFYTGQDLEAFGFEPFRGVPATLNLVEVIPLSDLEDFRLPLEDARVLEFKHKPVRLKDLDPAFQSLTGIDVKVGDKIMLGKCPCDVEDVADGGTLIRVSLQERIKPAPDMDWEWAKTYHWLIQTSKGWTNGRWAPSPVAVVAK